MKFDPNAAAIAAAMLIAAAAAPARADSMTWQLRSFHPNAVELKFFSQNRKAVWPSPTSHYTLKDYKVASFKLNCIAGEKVCYGATVSGSRSRSWGMGAEGKAACKDCCYTCGGDTKTKIHDLNDR